MRYTKFDYNQAIRLKKERRRQVWKWKEVRYLFSHEVKDELLKLDSGDALADAIDEMNKDEIIVLIRRMVSVIKKI